MVRKNPQKNHQKEGKQGICPLCKLIVAGNEDQHQDEIEDCADNGKTYDKPIESGRYRVDIGRNAKGKDCVRRSYPSNEEDNRDYQTVGFLNENGDNGKNHADYKREHERIEHKASNRTEQGRARYYGKETEEFGFGFQKFGDELQ